MGKESIEELTRTRKWAHRKLLKRTTVSARFALSVMEDVFEKQP